MPTGKKKVVSAAPWSYSKIKDFKTCARSFHAKYVEGRFPFVDTPATIEGKKFHKAAEDHIRIGAPIPRRMKEWGITVEQVNKLRGEVKGEQKLAVNEKLEPCQYFGKDVWLRGQVDAQVERLDDGEVLIFDWKTGSAKYPDPDQLEIMALLAFARWPGVHTVKAALVFVKHNIFVKETYEREDVPDLWGKWLAEFRVMEKAFADGEWVPEQNGLCKRHCGVIECEFNGGFNGE